MSYTWITVSVEIVHLILFGPVYRNRLIKGIPVKMVARDAMDQYVNIELGNGAVARDAMDQCVNIELANGAVARDAMDQYVNIELADGAIARRAMDQYVNICESNIIRWTIFHKLFFLE